MQISEHSNDSALKITKSSAVWGEEEGVRWILSDSACCKVYAIWFNVKSLRTYTCK